MNTTWSSRSINPELVKGLVDLASEERHNWDSWGNGFEWVTLMNAGQLPAAAANKDRIRGGQLGQNLRGAPLGQLQVVDSELFPVGPDEGTGLAPALYRAHGAVGSQQSQLHRYRTGA